jgi:hypothetical protein
VTVVIGVQENFKLQLLLGHYQQERTSELYSQWRFQRRNKSAIVAGRVVE